MRLIIIRGPSGSFKSTIAGNIAGDGEGIICEADQFFDRNGHYQFDAKLLGQAHSFCQNKVRQAMIAKTKIVIVSNTSMTLKEMQIYLDLAREASYTIEVIKTPGPWRADVLVKRNVHAVPLGTIQRQINKYQPFEGEIEWKMP